MFTTVAICTVTGVDIESNYTAAFIVACYPSATVNFYFTVISSVTTSTLTGIGNDVVCAGPIVCTRVWSTLIWSGDRYHFTWHSFHGSMFKQINALIFWLFFKMIMVHVLCVKEKKSSKSFKFYISYFNITFEFIGNRKLVPEKLAWQEVSYLCVISNHRDSELGQMLCTISKPHTFHSLRSLFSDI